MCHPFRGRVRQASVADRTLGAPRPMAYRLLEHTADLGVEVQGQSLNDLFAECVAALTDCLTRHDRVQPMETRRLALTAPDLEQILVALLTEVVVLFEIEGLVFRRAEVAVEQSEKQCSLTATLQGEPFDLNRHGFKTLVKAVTYHGLSIRQGRAGWRARIVFDI
jgi:SHS2 domain-containing protein